VVGGILSITDMRSLRPSTASSPVQQSKVTGARITLPFSIRSQDAGGRIVVGLVAVGCGKFPLSIIGFVVDTYHE